MSDATTGVISAFASVGFVSMIVSQWRSGDFFDPILSAFVLEPSRRPLMWIMTVIYGLLAILSAWVAIKLLGVA